MSEMSSRDAAAPSAAGLHPSTTMQSNFSISGSVQEATQLSRSAEQASVGSCNENENTKRDNSVALKKATTKSTMTSGKKRPLMPTSRDGRALSEKKLRRLEKNRLSARECRRRKREAAQSLERELDVLEEENLRLRLQLQIGQEAEKNLRKQEEETTEQLALLLKDGASEGDIYSTIEDFKEKFADYGRNRRSAIDFHLKNVERLLMPTTTTAVTMRALRGGANVSSQSSEIPTPSIDDGQPPLTKIVPDSAGVMVSEAYGNETVNSITTTTPTLVESPRTPVVGDPKNPSAPIKLDPKSLFQFMVNLLQVTPEQARELKDSLFVAKELDSCLEKSLSVLDELRQRLTKCGEDLETEFNNVRSILSPTQTAKFLVWVSNNSACMHMLNELWNRVYPNPAVEDQEEDDDVSKKKSSLV